MAATYAPHKIRVNALAPGLIRTPMSARAQERPEIRDRMRAKQPLCETFWTPTRSPARPCSCSAMTPG
jgi:NAD(P)-dependent dehydrogenase (short-subunit alcohol dehydrogenase family)